MAMVIFFNAISLIGLTSAKIRNYSLPAFFVGKDFQLPDSPFVVERSGLQALQVPGFVDERVDLKVRSDQLLEQADEVEGSLVWLAFELWKGIFSQMIDLIGYRIQVMPFEEEQDLGATQLDG